MEKNWKKEVARDTMALGSIPFYLIVIIRLIIGEYTAIFYQIIIALIVLFLISKFFENFNAHIARGFVLFVFTSLFYKDVFFTVFAFMLFIAMILSALYIKIKKNHVTNGCVIGVVAAGIAHYLSFLI